MKKNMIKFVKQDLSIDLSDKEVKKMIADCTACATDLARDKAEKTKGGYFLSWCKNCSMNKWMLKPSVLGGTYSSYSSIDSKLCFILADYNEEPLGKTLVKFALELMQLIEERRKKDESVLA